MANSSVTDTPCRHASGFLVSPTFLKILIWALQAMFSAPTAASSALMTRLWYEFGAPSVLTVMRRRPTTTPRDAEPSSNRSTRMLVIRLP